MHSPSHHEYQARSGNPIGESMGTFVTGAVQRGELTDFGLGEAIRTEYPREILWALLFAPCIRCGTPRARMTPVPQARSRSNRPSSA